jgi:REP element-mobilizing transposase RayT
MYSLNMPALYKLHYAWTGWPRAPWTPADPTPSPLLLEEWTRDGIQPLSLLAKEDRIRFLFTAQPDVSPAFLAARVKGRLQHHWRRLESFPGFDRPFLLRTLGFNHHGTVRGYIRQQVNASSLVDPLFRKKLAELRFQEENPGSHQTRNKGRYDLVLHLVLVTGGRHRMWIPEARRVLEALTVACDTEGIGLLDISMMPDHVHLRIRSRWEAGPEETLEAIKRCSGTYLRRPAFWMDGGYAGSVGPYRLGVAMRRNREAGGWCAECGGREEASCSSRQAGVA